MPRVFIKTYGCQMNERDSEQVAQMLVARGYQMTGTRGCRRGAAEYLLGPRHGRAKSHRQDGHARAACAMRGPRWSSAFSAAWRRAAGEELVRASGHVDLVVGTQKFHRVADYVDEILAAARERGRWTIRVFPLWIPGRKTGRRRPFAITSWRSGQATAFVSIMQGCDMHCTFCIVPSTRGGERSRANRGDRRRGERTGGARRAGGDAAGADRQSVRAA